MASGGRRVVGRPSFWEPSRPNGVPRDTPLSEAPSTTGDVEWVHPPSTSHIARFRYYDARESSFLRRFGDQGGASQLHVVFRDADTGGDGPEYWYFFADAAAGAAVAEAMTGHPHPYGGVLYPEVIEPNRVPYRRQSA